MVNYYNSGVYLEPFYTKHKIDYGHLLDGDLTYNYQLFLKYNSVEEYENEDDIKEQIDTMFLEDISYWSTYFEPLIFNEEIALDCGLTPFTYKGKNMLALSGCGMNLSPKLDVYQALTDNTIDEHSLLFSDSTYFENVVGKILTEKTLNIIGHAQQMEK